MDGVDSSFVVDDDERWVCVLERMVLVRENMVVLKRNSALAFGWQAQACSWLASLWLPGRLLFGWRLLAAGLC
jgi:hypothetical protein